MTKHTPGPWVYCTRLSASENHKGYYIKCNKFVLAFEVIPVDRDGKEGEANARLIAAAPCLLKELQHLVKLLGYMEAGSGLDVPGLATINGARAAIAKATGEDRE